MYIVVSNDMKALQITTGPADDTLTVNATPANAYLASLKGAGKVNMRSVLNKIARIVTGNDVATLADMNWATLNAANVAAIMARIHGAPATQNQARSALRGVARAAWRMGHMSADELAKIEDIKGARGTRELKGRDVEAWELAALMRACAADTTPAGRRDAALIALAAKTGARRHELAKITLANMTQTGECWTIKVIGKGDKERTMYADNGACKAINGWLNVRGNAPGALFVAINKGGKIDADHAAMSPTAVHVAFHKRADEAGVDSIDMHDMRRTFAGALLSAGEDIATVAALMGHSDVKTTAHYDRRPADQRRKAAAKISVPYFGA